MVPLVRLANAFCMMATALAPALRTQKSPMENSVTGIPGWIRLPLSAR